MKPWACLYRHFFCFICLFFPCAAMAYNFNVNLHKIDFLASSHQGLRFTATNDGQEIIAYQKNRNASFFRSEDGGLTWKTRRDKSIIAWQSINYSNDNSGQLVAIGENTLNHPVLLLSPDSGDSWGLTKTDCLPNSMYPWDASGTESLSAWF